MKPALPLMLLMSQALLSGCAASLVYDRDRPAGDCGDRQRCLHSTSPGGAMYPEIQQPPTDETADWQLARAVSNDQI
jgi:hypothetical protein